MRIRKLHLENFKRFTDLTLQDIPQDTQLVLLIGSNGSGKSSVFDAFEIIASQNGKSYVNTNLNFIKDQKNGNLTALIDTYEYGEEGFSKGSVNRTNKITSGSLYGRTSFRQVPRLTRISLGNQVNIQADGDRPSSFIDRDQRFENDIEHLLGKLLKEFFRSSEDKSEIKNKVIIPINNALERIFNTDNGTKLSLLEIIPPLEGKIAEINFKKGSSVFHYNYLSAGEKEVFNILINLIARQEYYQDTIYYFDEIDLHLNTALQFNFLKEITEHWIPPSCQFWTASHSLGFIEYAKQASNAVIIDFDSYDFDLPRTLTPEPKESLDVYEIAVPKEILQYVLRGAKPVVVENTNDEYYNLALAEKGYLFLPAQNSMQVFLAVKGDKNTVGLRDKDYLRPDEVQKIQKVYPNLKILDYYAFENYVYHPDNIAELNIKGFDRSAYIEQIIKAKNQQLMPVVAHIGTSRQTYIELKDAIKDDKNIAPIYSAFESNDFNIFYPYFNMKEFDKTYLGKFNLQIKDLVKTQWFKHQIEEILNR